MTAADSTQGSRAAYDFWLGLIPQFLRLFGWTDMAGKLAGATPAQFDSAFERTYGALSDGLGLSPVRKLYVAWRDVQTAGSAQQEARMLDRSVPPAR
jgi:hypothetical protein